jgi:hypothetical protein
LKAALEVSLAARIRAVSILKTSDPGEPRLPADYNSPEVAGKMGDCTAAQAHVAKLTRRAPSV